MAEAITTNSFRKRLAHFFYDGASTPPLAKFKYMAFGDGGHDVNRVAITPDADQTALNHELLRIEVTSIEQEDDYSTTGVGTLAKADLVGSNISEAGLLDENGSLLGFRNFAPKVKESDEEFVIRIKLKF